MLLLLALMTMMMILQMMLQHDGGLNHGSRRQHPSMSFLPRRRPQEDDDDSMHHRRQKPNKRGHDESNGTQRLLARSFCQCGSSKSASFLSIDVVVLLPCPSLVQQSNASLLMMMTRKQSTNFCAACGMPLAFLIRHCVHFLCERDFNV